MTIEDRLILAALMPFKSGDWDPPFIETCHDCGNKFISFWPSAIWKTSGPHCPRSHGTGSIDWDGWGRNLPQSILWYDDKGEPL